MNDNNCERSEPTSLETVHYGPRRSKSAFRTILVVLFLGAIVVALFTWFGDEISLEARAFQGQAEAQYLIGKRHFDTASSPRDYDRAVVWVRKAADQGYANAQTGLGLMYENGLGLRRNYTEALKWLRRAADQGFGVAQNELGVMYAKGRGVPRDLNEASKWCRLAAAQGSEVAKRNLELVEAAKPEAAISDLTTRTRESYKNVTVRKVESDGVTIAFQPPQGGLGLAKVKMENLPENLQELCGHAAKGKAISNSGSAYSQLDSISSAL